MKKILIVVAVIFVLGCDRKDAAMKANGEANRFNFQVQAGLTTRAQEQAFIAEIAACCYQLDRFERGTNKANETLAAAKANISAPKASVVPLEGK